MQYVLLSAYNVSTLVEEVNEYLLKGYSLYGDPFGAEADGQIRVFQAMTYSG